MVAIKGVVKSNSVWDNLPYGSVKLQMFSLTHDGINSHHCDYCLNTDFIQEIPMLEMIYSTENEKSLISKLGTNDIIEIECHTNSIKFDPNYLLHLKEVVNGQIKFYNLKISERFNYVKGMKQERSTISLINYNPENKYKHNWVKSTKEFIGKLVKLPEIPNSLIPAELTIPVTTPTTQKSATQESATQELVNV
jgi:hypothetical protein